MRTKTDVLGMNILVLMLPPYNGQDTHMSGLKI